MNSVTPDISAAIVAEQRLLSPVVRANPDALDRMLAPDFIEIGKSGRLWSRAETLDELARDASSSTAVEAARFTGRELLPGVILVNYISGIGADLVWRTSVWRDTPSGWQLAFHQGTPIAI